jgi:RNA polymerase sigma-70 factor (ECF subfamily)
MEPDLLSTARELTCQGSDEHAHPVFCTTTARETPAVSKGAERTRLANWFHQWRTPLRRFLQSKRSVSAADIDDVAQEVFLRLMRYDRGALVENPQAYLFKVASNVVAEWSIRCHNARPHDPAWLLDLHSHDQPENQAMRSGACAEVERALNTLDARQRAALKLQFLEGLSHAQIAERMGTTPRTVKRILAKSYQKLRQQLDPSLLQEISHGRE